MTLPTPEQLDAMAREYGTVQPIAPPPKPQELEALCRAVSELDACVSPLTQAPSVFCATLATQAAGAIGRIQSQLAAMDESASDYDAPPPKARNYTELVRLGLLAQAKVTRELYSESEGKSLAQQLPYLTSLSHYVGSLLLSITAF